MYSVFNIHQNLDNIGLIYNIIYYRFESISICLAYMMGVCNMSCRDWVQFVSPESNLASEGFRVDLNLDYRSSSAFCLR